MGGSVTGFQSTAAHGQARLRLLPREATSLLHNDGLHENREKNNPEEHGILETFHDVPAVGDGPGVELVEDLGHTGIQAIANVKKYAPPTAVLNYKMFALIKRGTIRVKAWNSVK